MHILHAFFIFILSLIGIAVFVPTILLLFNPFLDNAWQQKQKQLTVIVSTITTKTVRGGVLARAPTLSKRAQTQRRQRRRSALLEVVCFSHLFHTHTHTHARTSNTQSYPHTHTNKKKRLEVCVILLLGQLEATFLGNCQLPQYFNYGLSACVCAHNSICWPNWEGHRERRREGEHTPARGFVRLVASRATIGRSPTTTNTGTFSRNHSLSSSCSLSLSLLLSARTFYKQAVDR